MSHVSFFILTRIKKTVLQVFLQLFPELLVDYILYEILIKVLISQGYVSLVLRYFLLSNFNHPLILLGESVLFQRLENQLFRHLSGLD